MNRDGSCKVLFHVPHFVDHQLAGRNTLHSNIHAKQKDVAKKLTFLLRAIMISQEVDLVAGAMVLHGDIEAKTTFGTIDEAFTVSTLSTPPYRPPLWGQGSIPDMWADVCGLIKQPGSQRFWSEQTWCLLYSSAWSWSTSHRS